MASWRKNALQERSKETENALASAARELLSDRSFSEIRVDEVARNAGISVGGFYARFKGKNALLHLADIDFLKECTIDFDAAVPEEFSGDLDDLLREFITVMIRLFDQHRETIVESMKYAEEDDRSDFRQRATDFNNFVHGRLRAIMNRLSDEITHPDPVIAINMAIFIASATARAAVLQGALSTYPIDLTQDDLISELVTNASSYLKGASK